MRTGTTDSGDRARDYILVRALEELGDFVSSYRWDAVPEVHESLVVTLLDTTGVTLAGSQTREARSLAEAWDTGSGRARVLGAGTSAASETAAYLNGFSAVTLELDEGNKYAGGHPAAHTFPAALAVAQELHSSGPELAAALVAGYEAASRFGRATRLRPGVHPHGNWGTAGAAVAVSRLMGLDARTTAAALDVAGGSALAAPFEAALAGSAARDGWVGIANFSGIAAARMAAAGIVEPHGLPGMSLGKIIGDLESAELSAGLGQRFDLSNGYFKRHACCSFTHPPADAALKLIRENPGLKTSRLTRVTVETHSIAAPLDRTEYPTRLAAMFSIPYVVAVALVRGGCAPEAFEERARTDPEVLRLAQLTRVSAEEEFDRRLPEERAARITLELDDGSTLQAEVPNPVGDVAHFPFGLSEVRGKLERLLPPEMIAAEELESGIRNLLHADDVNDVLDPMP